MVLGGLTLLCISEPNLGSFDVSFNYGDFSAIIKGYFTISECEVLGKGMK
jgi:hypothetical protein